MNLNILFKGCKKQKNMAALMLVFSTSSFANANTTEASEFNAEKTEGVIDLSIDNNLTTGGVQLDTVEILGETYRNTATKAWLPANQTPQGISVVDQQTLKAQAPKSLNQALRYTAGVVTENRGGAVTMFDTFTVRGYKVDQSHYDGLLLQYLTGWNLQP